MPASCFAQGAQTELLFPPIHNPFPRSLAYNLKPSTFTNLKKLTRREPFPSILWKNLYIHRLRGRCHFAACGIMEDEERSSIMPSTFTNLKKPPRREPFPFAFIKNLLI